MGLNKIESLIEKYENGETSLQEEQLLMGYFAKDDVAPHLEVYTPMFNYFAKTKAEKYTNELPFKKSNEKYYKLMAVAAAVIIMFSVVFYPQGPTEQEQQQALMAYNETMQALSLVSNQLNEGKEVLSPLNILNTNLNEGMHKANLIKEFSETTNLVYNPSNN
ncbi:hypothetical protein SAMN03097699_0270 [Flavobacteriaceae bacterium MAR_2010_188]|nr:hypothetical protein SAMN03097699_0270 [Flavobacteriaceae bacterium MAR_2010_188]